MDKVELVLEGIKPALVSEYQIFTGMNKLSQVQLEEWHQGKKVKYNYAISLKNWLVSDVIKPGDITEFLKYCFSDNLARLYDEIKKSEITEAFAKLRLIPKIDSISKNPPDIERPEVSVLEGLLFGYNPCCIDYYVETRHIGAERHSLENAKTFSYEKLLQMLLCSQCTSDLIHSGITDYKSAFKFLKLLGR